MGIDTALDRSCLNPDLTFLHQPLGVVHDGPEARDGRRELLLEVADHEDGVLGGQLAQLPQPGRCHCCIVLLQMRSIH